MGVLMAHIGGTTRGDLAYFNTEIMDDMIFLAWKLDIIIYIVRSEKTDW